MAKPAGRDPLWWGSPSRATGTAWLQATRCASAITCHRCHTARPVWIRSTTRDAPAATSTSVGTRVSGWRPGSAPGSSASRKRERRAREQLAVHGTDLVGHRLDVAGRYRKHRIEQPGQLDSLSLGDELEIVGVGVEGTGAAPRDLKRRLVLPVEHLLRETTVEALEGQLRGVWAVPVDRDNLDRLRGTIPTRRAPALICSSFMSRCRAGDVPR